MPGFLRLGRDTVLWSIRRSLGSI
ncbi:hypothetical protein BN1263440007 [Stenotrophomonas indicatrix]|nr:hypothetical protein BN1263440007 [Stenotrophomonas indicatrix]